MCSGYRAVAGERTQCAVALERVEVLHNVWVVELVEDYPRRKFSHRWTILRVLVFALRLSGSQAPQRCEMQEQRRQQRWISERWEFEANFGSGLQLGRGRRTLDLILGLVALGFREPAGVDLLDDALAHPYVPARRRCIYDAE